MTRRKKKKIIISAMVGAVLLLGGLGYSHYDKNRVEGISIEQRLEDLEFLHEKLESTYMSNHDLNQAYDSARIDMKESKSKGSYYHVLSKYMASICDPYSRPFTDSELVNYYFHFSKQADTGGFVDMLTNDKTLNWYGWTLEEIDSLDLYFPPIYSTNNSGESFKYMELDEGKVGYLKVYNMNYKAGKEQQMTDHLNEIYREAEGKEKLIIDIRGIYAFDDVFWKKEMVAPLIYGKKSIEETYLLKSEKNKAYYETLGFAFESVDEEELVGVQSPYNEMSKWVSKKEVSIEGTRKEANKTKIYLLVNERTGGEAAKLAHFAKSSGFATLVGTETRKAYSMHLPSIFKLEESGIIIGIYDLVFLTPEGNHCFYAGVKPDIEIKNHESRVDSFDVGVLSIVDM